MQTSIRLAVIAAVLTIALAACGTSQDAKPLGSALPEVPVPEYRVGDEFLFKVGPIEDMQRVTATDTDTVTYQTRVFGEVRQYKAFANPANWSGGSFAGPMKVSTDRRLDGLFPLRVGNIAKASGMSEFNGIKTQFELTCSVPRQENIAVAAGRFDTIVVNCEFIHEKGSYNYTYWFAPSVGHWVAVRRAGRYQELAAWKKAVP